MKKKITIIFMIMICFIISGCEAEQKVTLDTNISDGINIDDDGAKLICTIDMDYTEYNYTLGSKYVVFANKDNKVTKVKSSEIINSSDEEKLDEFESYLNSNHDLAMQYNGYTYDVKREKDKVISEVTIDYNEFDLKKFVEENKSVTDEELTIDSIEKQYVSLGATCTRKD